MSNHVICSWCGEEFIQTHPLQKYCNKPKKCKSKAHTFQNHIRRKKVGRNDRESKRCKALKSLLRKKATSRGKRYASWEVSKILAKEDGKYVQTSAELALELGRTQTSIQQVRRRHGKNRR
jgi:hypothetical protein